MKSVCTPVLRHSLASSCSLPAAVRPGAVMSTGSPRTQTACEPRLSERQPGCAATVSSALSAYASRSPDQLLLPSPARRDAASPRGGSENDCCCYYCYYFVLQSKRGGPVPPPPSPLPTCSSASGESCEKIGGQNSPCSGASDGAPMPVAVTRR